MYPIAFSILGKEIHWYGVCMAVGFFAATCVLLFHKKYAKMTTDQIFDSAILALITGILGARIFYVVQFWKQNFAGRSIWSVFRIDQGGLVFYGGFLVAITAVIIYAVRKKISFLRLLDITAPAIAVAHACGRVGCFLQGCCFGKPVSGNPWYAVVYPHGSEPAIRYPAAWAVAADSLKLYPVQLFESAANCILCVFLIMLLHRKKQHQGCVAGIYLILYACIRFAMEFFRGDHTDYYLGLTVSQNIALFVMIPQGILVWVIGMLIREKKGSNDKAAGKKEQKGNASRKK